MCYRHNAIVYEFRNGLFSVQDIFLSIYFRQNNFICLVPKRKEISHLLAHILFFNISGTCKLILSLRLIININFLYSQNNDFLVYNFLYVLYVIIC